MEMTPDWNNSISQIVASPGVVMVIGAADTGKTTFCAQLCAAAFEAGVPTAIVDADVGQSEVGAPGTVGLAIVDRQFESLSSLKPKRLHFVGATTPVTHMLECVVGVKRMVDAAQALGVKLVVVDTTGLVDGALGRHLKTCKIDLVRPNYLVGVQKRHEIDHLLRPFGGAPWTTVIQVQASEFARRKAVEFRTARRRQNFYDHFNDAPGHLIHLDEITTWNTWLESGRRMKWQYMKFIEDSMKCRVLHAELTGRGVFVIAERKCSPGGLKDLEELFKTKSISIVTAEAFSNLLCGLADENGNTLNVGLIQAIDFKQRFMFVLSPMKTITPVKLVQFGYMRVARDGKELGTLRQGEI